MIAPTLLAGLALTLSAPPPAAPPPSAAVPSHASFRLDNGLEVVLFESTGSPWLEAQLVVRAGSLADPPGKAGLAALTAGLMKGGTTTRDEAALSDHLAALGASLEVDVDRHTLSVEGGIPTFDPAAVDSFLDTLVDVALRPAFDPAVVARDVKLRTANIRRLVARHGALADLAVRIAVFGDTPDGRPGFGLADDIETITPADVRAWHRRVMTPSHAVLLIGGAFNEGPLRAWIARRFGPEAFPATSVRCEAGAFVGHCARLCDTDGCLDNPSALPRGTASRAASRTLVTIADENVPQIQWRLGFTSDVTAMAPGYGALRVGFHALGGDFTSRLNATLRTREGLTYGAYASADFGALRPELVVIRTDAPPPTLTRSLDLTRGMLTEIRTTPLGDGELDEMRSNLINGFAFRFESVQSTLGQLRYLYVRGLPKTWLERWPAAIAAPSAKQIQVAMAEALPDSGAHLVVVGPASLLPALEAWGDGSPAWSVVSAEDLVRRGLGGAPGTER